MAEFMNIQIADGVGLENAGFKFQYKETLAAAGAGEWIIFPRGAKGVTAILDATAGSGRLEATTSSREAVEAGTVDTAEIVPWPYGDLSAAKKEIRIHGVMAFRQVNIGGTTIMSAIGNN